MSKRVKLIQVRLSHDMVQGHAFVNNMKEKEISGLYEQALTVQGRPELLNQFQGRISTISECNCRFSLVPFIMNHIQIKSLINQPSVFVTNIIADR